MSDNATNETAEKAPVLTKEQQIALMDKALASQKALDDAAAKHGAELQTTLASLFSARKNKKFTRKGVVAQVVRRESKKTGAITYSLRRPDQTPVEDMG